MRALLILITAFIFSLGSCYSFKDVSIPPEVKTARVNYIENRAGYVNPQLSPQLTDRLRQKINNQTRLTLVATDQADYDIYAEIRGYNVTTAGISEQQAATNRLQITVHIVFKNRLDEKANFEADINRNFDFNAGQSLQQAEAQQSDEILKNLTDEIFNRIFSNW
ncbi:MAG TPA: LptE family protein [Flavitalea sp.]|nr:LptE family protein [Flavitalea sp.]